MRLTYSSGCGLPAVGTLLFLVAAAWIAQPDLPGLRGLFDRTLGLFTGEGRGAAEQVEVEDLAVEDGRVRGRVTNTSATTLRAVTVRVRLRSASGSAQTAEATVYGLAAGQETWVGIPLLPGHGVTAVELDTVIAVAGPDAGGGVPPRRLPGDGMRDVERAQRDMEMMQEAARSVTR